MFQTRTYHLEITSDMQNLAVVSDFILDIAKQSNLDDKTTDHLQMALDEAVTNVMEHGYAGRSDGIIKIDCRVDKRSVQIEIRDQGEPFDPDQIKEPDVTSPLSERAIGGLGVFFMRKLMDQVEFSRDRRGNRTRMVKQLQ